MKGSKLGIIAALLLFLSVFSWMLEHENRVEAQTTGVQIPVVTVNPVHIASTTDATIGLLSSTKSAVTTSVNVKASAGNVYGVFFLNGAVAGCWIELINASGAGTLGTGVVTNIPMANAGTALLMFNPPITGFTSGIAVGSATAAGGGTQCGTATTGIVVLYK